MYSFFQLTNLVQGRYVFTLTVSDDQGLTSSDTVSVNVRRDMVSGTVAELDYRNWFRMGKNYFNVQLDNK